MALLLSLGVIAGALTTISGFGGGLLLVLALAVVSDAKHALVVTALGLLVGNSHRLFLYRRSLSWSIGRPLLFGVIPGALAGALFAVSVPTIVINLLMLGVVGLALARAFWGFTWVLPSHALTASGLLIGALTATAGGAGLLVGPLLLASGLSGTAYLATTALCAACMHASRIVGYAIGGMYDGPALIEAALLACALITGNFLGDAIRARLGERALRWIELGAPVLALILALAGAV